ncbi:MAG: S24/S26 family peptidase [Bacteroides sp.]|nr:S24/S26 family peptidase [Bacteroides sp.]
MKRVTMVNDLLFGEVGRLLEEGKRVTLLTKGNSMRPFIEGEKDSVELQKSEHVRRGDILLAKVKSGRHVMHRVIRICGDDITLMGDGNLHGQEYCQTRDVLGTVMLIRHASGRTTDCQSAMHQTAALLWRWLLPFRRYLLAIHNRLFVRRK